MSIAASLLATLSGACGGSNDGGGLPANDGGASDATTPPPPMCVPGQQVACGCPGGGNGAQICRPDGTGYGACLGCAGNDAATDATLPDAAIADGATPDGAIDDAGSDGSADDGATPDGGFHDGGIPEAGPDGGACVTVPAARAPVFLLFALDGSGSMSDANKWTAATSAINTLFTDMNAKADPGQGAGLIVFSDSKDPTCNPLAGLGGCTGPYPSSVDVPIAFVDTTQLGKLTGRTSGATPTNDTPTGAVLTGAYAELTSFSPSAPLPPSGQKVVVLITDGVPTDECLPAADGGAIDYTQNPCVVRAAQAHATAAPGGPIDTFVVGVGAIPSTDPTTYDPLFLGALAKAGGRGPAGCDPTSNAANATNRCYFNIDPAGSASTTQAALEAALDDIRGQLGTCTVPIALGAAGPLDPNAFNVTLGGAVVPEGPSGWTFDVPAAPKNVVLHGSACATITSAPTTKIDFVVGCPTITQ